MKLPPPQLDAILADHKLWLAGKGGARADLTGADLTGADLTGVDLTRATLTRANLTDATLTRADLTGATLTGATLTEADLTRADLTAADLTGADLTDATLARATLARADLTGADLTAATLARANLTCAKGIRRLPVSEPRSYEWIAVKGRRGWRVFADGRAFTLDEARALWMAPSYAGPPEVKSTVGFALDWLEKIAAAEINRKQEPAK